MDFYINYLTSSSSSGSGPENLSFLSASVSHSRSMLTDLCNSSACLRASSSRRVLLVDSSHTRSQAPVSSPS